MKYYYLLKGKIMSANEKMPELRIVKHKDYNQKFEDSKFKMFYNNWLNSLQPCEISESELCLILSNVTKLDYDNPIEVTDIISDNNGVITFKEKQVGEIEAVEFAEWIDKNEFTRTITFNFNPLWVSNNIYYSGCQYTTKQLYEIFKNQK